MLYPNGQRAITFPGTRIAGNLAASGKTAYSGLGGARFNRYVSDTYSKVIGAVPSGYSGRAYVLAVKRGGLAAFSGLQITSSATGGLGLPGFGDASISFVVDDATGQLISSGAGTAAMSFTAVNALLTASISGMGTASLTLATNAPLLGAKAGAVGSASFVITGTLTPYAIGSMTGSTLDSTVLTSTSISAAVWSATASSNNLAGTMGSKLNSAASGGVDYTAMAAAVASHVIEGGVTLESALRIMLAPLAGKATGVDSLTPVYYAQDGVTPRVSPVMDAQGNRTAVAVNGS